MDSTKTSNEVKRNKKAFKIEWNQSVEITLNILHDFTETYKKYSSNIYLRELECLRIQSKILFHDINEKDLFAGRHEQPIIGFSIQAKEGGDKFGYYMVKHQMEALQNNPDLTGKQKIQVNELIEFWKEENTVKKTRDAYPPKMQEVLPSDSWQNEPGIAFPLYRMSGTQFDNDKLLTLGISALKSHITEKKETVSEDTSAFNLYEAMEGALELFSDVCILYSERAKDLTNTTNSEKRKKDLANLSVVLKNISHKKPENLYEAIQLSYLYSVFAGSVNYGRMDVYLGDYYVNDIEKDTLTVNEAQLLINNFWQLIDDRIWVYDSRVVIGGRGRRNEKNANKFALAAMKASESLGNVSPQLTLRFYNGQSPELYNYALSMIGKGCVFPLLYNDDVNIPAVHNAFEVSEKIAEDYIPFGCGEYTLYHKSVGTPSGVINLLQTLLVTLNNGKEPATGKWMGLALGEASSFKTFDDLFNAYKKQVEHHVIQLGLQEALEYDIAGETSPFLFLSMLYDDCIEAGKSIFKGGLQHLGGTLETYGNTNTADSLTAIKKLVYDDKKFTMEELIHMLAVNFEGFEKEQKMLLDAPKFGNDDDYADQIRVEVDRHVSLVTKEQKNYTKLDSYLIVIINNDANTVMGRYTAASPDGRKAFTHMANANAPSGGSDKNGITAMLNSMIKPNFSIHAGAVQNMKFSKSMFTSYRPQLEALLSTYFSMGGPQAMINVLDKGDLEKAMLEPEKYANLVVRVGGFCARFVELSRDVQEEILSRNLY